MIVAGVLVSPAVAARFGPLVDLLVRAHARQNGVPVDADLDALLKELVHVGLAHRDRVSAEAPRVEPVVSVWRECEECGRSVDKLRRGLCNACRMRRARRGHIGKMTA